MSNTNNTLSSAKDMKGLRFLQPFRDRQRFSFSGCSNTNKAKPLCDIPASIAFWKRKAMLAGRQYFIQ